MQTLYYNGNVYVNQNQFAEAFVVDNGLFSFVGSNQDAQNFAADYCQRVDLNGQTVVPGFNDSHLHFYMTAGALQSVELGKARSIRDAIQMGKDFLQANPAVSILIGRGWNQDYFSDEVRLLTRHDLDKISTQIPIVYTRACGHVVTANTLALTQANITSDSFVEGGEVYTENGELTGVISENAIVLLDVPKQQITVDDVVTQLRMVSRAANACGITSVQTNDLRVGDPSSDVIEEAYRLYALDHPTVRMYHQICFTDLDAFKQRIAQGYHCHTNDFNRYGPLKAFTDGSLGARTAYLRLPYHDDESTVGLPTLTQNEIDEYVSIASQNNIQVAMHAIGDAAITSVLNAYEAVYNGKNILRHGIVHCQITDMTILNRFQELDVVPYLQPIFLHYDLHIVEDRVGKELASTSYAFHTMDEMGLHVAYGTDSPVEPFNVMNCLHCAVNRTDLNNEPVGGFHPEQKVSIGQAIDNYTIGSAHASFEEHVKGRILPNYFADFVVLSDNIFQINPLTIKDVQVVQTVVNGTVVFQQ